MAHQYHTSASISTWLEQAVRLHFIAISSCGVGLSTLFTVGPIKGGKNGELLRPTALQEKNMFVKAKTARSVVNQVFLKFLRTLYMCVDMYVHKIHGKYILHTCL